MTHILCLGEVMAELRTDGAGFAVGFAGDTYNTAVYCRRTLRGGRVSYVTRIGHDPLSDGFLAAARGHGVDTSAITRDGAQNLGIYAVKTDARGERSFAYWRSTSAARQMFQTPAELEPLGTADILYLSAISLAILTPGARAALLARLATLRAAGLRIAFDSNFRPSLWPDLATARAVVSQAWQLADIALPSVDDEMALFGDRDARAVLARLRGLGLRHGALKCGAEGPIALDPACPGQTYAPAERVVDTTAAGDSFNGTFLAAHAMGQDEKTALAIAHTQARRVVAAPGAIIAE